MLKIDDVLVSEEIISEVFMCDLKKCKGACCVEGDLGAPLQADELHEIDKLTTVVLPYLSKQSSEILIKNGGYHLDEDDEYSTTLVNNKACVFAYYDTNKILKCSIEQACIDGKTKFRKPISCHLYPIRQKKLNHGEALNYSQWHICSDACDLGKKLSIPLYQFLKEALIRKYGKSWYAKLLEQVEKRSSKEKE